MPEKKDCHGIPKYYYTRDWDGVPDGKANISSVTCSCCGERMQCTEVEPVDCGTSYYFECPNGCSGYSWYDLIPEC